MKNSPETQKSRKIPVRFEGIKEKIAVVAVGAAALSGANAVKPQEARAAVDGPAIADVHALPKAQLKRNLESNINHQKPGLFLRGTVSIRETVPSNGGTAPQGSETGGTESNVTYQYKNIKDPALVYRGNPHHKHGHDFLDITEVDAHGHPQYAFASIDRSKKDGKAHSHIYPYNPDTMTLTIEEGAGRTVDHFVFQSDKAGNLNLDSAYNSLTHNQQLLTDQAGNPEQIALAYTPNK